MKENNKINMLVFVLVFSFKRNLPINVFAKKAQDWKKKDIHSVSPLRPTPLFK